MRSGRLPASARKPERTRAWKASSRLSIRSASALRRTCVAGQRQVKDEGKVRFQTTGSQTANLIKQGRIHTAPMSLVDNVG